MQDRRYLNVPYADKTAVKAIGGLWDGLTKLWYVPKHVPLASVRKWVIRRRTYQ